MVQLKILSGKQAGASWVARRFPVRLGRSADADLRLQEDGVWDQHLLLQFNPAEGVTLLTQGEALACVNGEAVKQAALCNGDQIEVGPVKLQFWLSETRQGGLRIREWLTWSGILAVILAQLAILWRLLR